MNERIEAYLKQHYCRDYFNRYGEKIEDDYYFMYREEVDGLIELIVRECADVADKGVATFTMKGPEWPSYYINKHFGIKDER